MEIHAVPRPAKRLDKGKSVVRVGVGDPRPAMGWHPRVRAHGTRECVRDETSEGMAMCRERASGAVVE